MKTKLYVPLMLSSITPDTRPLYVRDLRAMEADVMWIAPDRYTLFLPDRTFLMLLLYQNYSTNHKHDT